MNAIRQWFASHNISSHTIVGGLTFAIGLYVTNSDVKAIVDAFLSNHKNLAAFATIVVAAYLKYSHGHNQSNGDSHV